MLMQHSNIAVGNLGILRVMWKLMGVVMVAALAAQCASAQTSTAPVSRRAPYTVLINGTASAAVVVLSTENYIVSLEGDPCAITVRHRFSNVVAHLLWTANYYVGSLSTSTKCTLKFTQDGDLQLIAHSMGSDTMIWNSNTAGKGITQMALENSFDSGDFQLLTANNKVIYRSFDVKEFAILPTQKFRPGEKLVAPNAFFNHSRPQILFSGNRYSLKLESGDLRLYSDFGSGQKLYWSLKKTLYQGDLSQVAYASIVTDVGGIGLFKSNGALVWTSGKIGIITSNPHDTYFSVEPDGNLRTFVLVKGLFWSSDFEAIPNNCDLPSYCGEYGVCSNNQCSCLPNWVPNNRQDLTQGCKTKAPFTKCTGSGNHRQILRFTGYDYIYNQYSTPLPISVSACHNKCLADCSCRAYFYNANTGMCYVTNEVRTLKVSDSKKMVVIMV